LEGIAVKNTLAATRERSAHWTGPRGLSPRLLLYAALAGELGTVVYLLTSGNVSPVLVRSLQLFLRF
jgi:hypothetical protein